MTLHAFRILKARYADSAFSGEGARRVGGRWNSPGVRVVYTAGSASLAMLEMLVHLESRELLQRYVILPVEFDENLIQTIDPARLPKSWRGSPPPLSLRDFGDEWAQRKKACVLRVPSVVVPTEWNYLLDPEHRRFGQIKIGKKMPVRFDQRLVERPES